MCSSFGLLNLCCRGMMLPSVGKYSQFSFRYLPSGIVTLDKFLLSQCLHFFIWNMRTIKWDVNTNITYLCIIFYLPTLFKYIAYRVFFQVLCGLLHFKLVYICKLLILLSALWICILMCRCVSMHMYEWGSQYGQLCGLSTKLLTLWRRLLNAMWKSKRCHI